MPHLAFVDIGLDPEPLRIVQHHDGYPVLDIFADITVDSSNNAVYRRSNPTMRQSDFLQADVVLDPRLLEIGDPDFFEKDVNLTGR